MPLYRVKNGKSFFYTRIWTAGEQVDYPGPAGTALELEDGEDPWPSQFQQGCGPEAAGGSAPLGADAPADLTDRLNRARSQMPDVVMRGDEPQTLSDVQAQDRVREDATRDKWNGADPASFDGDNDGHAGGSLTKAEIVADLEGMGIEFDPRQSRAKLLVQRNAGREARA
jgi:hypothetical protein